MLFLSILACFLSLVAAQSRTTPPAGAIVVSPNPSSGQFSTISAAVASLSTTSTAAQIIFIEPGTYTEQVFIPARAAKLTIYGSTTDVTSYTSNAVHITFNNCAACGAADDDATATVRNYAAGSRIYNVNIYNTFGAGSQALALSANAAEQGYYGIRLQGWQDTLLAETGTQLYAKSAILGATDFVFGQHAPAWFDGIDIRPVSGGTITASGRVDASDPNFYVFNKCNIAAASGSTVAAGSVFLGRPWSMFARVVFQETLMSDIINSAGWEIWSTATPNTADVTYEEFDNTGAGAAGTRASFSSKISSPIAISTILGSDYTSWVDTTYLS